MKSPIKSNLCRVRKDRRYWWKRRLINPKLIIWLFSNRECQILSWRLKMKQSADISIHNSNNTQLNSTSLLISPLADCKSFSMESIKWSTKPSKGKSTMICLMRMRARPWTPSTFKVFSKDTHNRPFNNFIKKESHGTSSRISPKLIRKI